MAIKAPNSANPSAITSSCGSWMSRTDRIRRPDRRIEHQPRFVQDGNERNDQTDGDSFEQGADRQAAQQDSALPRVPVA